MNQKLIPKEENNTKQVLILNKQSKRLSGEAGHAGSFILIPVLLLLWGFGSSCWFGHDNLYKQKETPNLDTLTDKRQCGAI